MNKTITEINFIDILPGSIAKDEKIKAAAQALDNELKQINGLIDTVNIYGALDTLPEPIIKHLAWQWHVDSWDESLTLAQKVALLRLSYKLHRHKGTPYAVEAGVGITFDGCKVTEWNEYNGRPFYFKLKINGRIKDENDFVRLDAQVAATKNERSIFEAFSLFRELKEPGKVGTILRINKKIEISPRIKADTIEDTGLYFGTVSRIFVNMTIKNNI